MRIGAPFCVLTAALTPTPLLAASLLPLSTSPSAALEAYIKAPNTGARDIFGGSVALDGDTLIVGAQYEDSCSTTPVSTTAAIDNGCTNAGAAYVYERVGGTWLFAAYLKAPNAGQYDYFGDSVALDGDTLIVGAGGEGSCSTTPVSTTASSNNRCGNRGAAYVYERVGITWLFTAYLKAPNAGPGDDFGNSVALDGDTLIVGAHYENSCSTTPVSTTASSDNGCHHSGAAYVYVRVGGAWQFHAYLKAPNTGQDDEFGGSVALDGDTLIVGAWFDDSCSTTPVSTTAAADNGCGNAGAAYVYERVGITWRFAAYLKAPNAGQYDWFGVTVALDGDTLIVGAELEDSCSTTPVSTTASWDTGCSHAGAAYVYERVGGTWRFAAYLKAPNAGQDDHFGASVALDGDTLIVGADEESSCSTTPVSTTASSDNRCSAAGAAYVYVRADGAWQFQAYLKAPNAGQDDNFGASVAVDGDTFIVEASDEGSCAIDSSQHVAVDSCPSAGAVYTYRLETLATADAPAAT